MKKYENVERETFVLFSSHSKKHLQLRLLGAITLTEMPVIFFPKLSNLECRHLPFNLVLIPLCSCIRNWI